MRIVGTRVITIRNSSQEALLIIIRRQNDDERTGHQDELAVDDDDNDDDENARHFHHEAIITTATTCYSGKVDPQDSKSPSEFFDQLLQPLESISLLAEEIVNTNTISVKLTVRQRLESGLVKLLYTKVLHKHSQEHCHQQLDLLKQFSNEIKEQNETYTTLQEAHESMKHELQGWKDTATKLDLQWQSEKDAMLSNFFTLYQTTHEALRKTKLELQQMEDRQTAAGRDYASLSSNRSNTVKKRAVDHPDDQDQLLYDIVTVDRLAAGPSMSSGPTMSSVAVAAHESHGAAKPPMAPLRSIGTENSQASDGRFPLGSGAVAVKSVKDLLNDPVLRRSTSELSSSDTTTAQRRRTANNATNMHRTTADATESSRPTKKPKISASGTDEQKEKESLAQGKNGAAIASSGNKKLKISASITDEKKQKELLTLAAMLDDDDEDAWM